MTLIRSPVTYASKTWSLSVQNINTVCTEHGPCLYRTWTLSVQNMDTVCTEHTHCLYRTWTLSVQNINNLLVSERQILRKIFGPIQCKEGWRI
jgi:hypothetical protein